ncbi:Hypothetical protein D9617_23g004770 [Elsinoe fawcettii]|nr:Hypothetical protein D9617_23g004770 [Elsinoe fawcettii]
MCGGQPVYCQCGRLLPKQFEACPGFGENPLCPEPDHASDLEDSLTHPGCEREFCRGPGGDEIAEWDADDSGEELVIDRPLRRRSTTQLVRGRAAMETEAPTRLHFGSRPFRTDQQRGSSRQDSVLGDHTADPPLPPPPPPIGPQPFQPPSPALAAFILEQLGIWGSRSEPSPARSRASFRSRSAVSAKVLRATEDGEERGRQQRR